MNDLLAFRDDGPLLELLTPARAAARSPSRFAWAAPPAARVVEYGTATVAAYLSGARAGPAVFALYAVIAFRHYSIVYALRHLDRPPSAIVRRAALGWEGRTLVVAAAAAAGVLVPVAWSLAVVLGLVFVVDAVRPWIRPE